MFAAGLVELETRAIGEPDGGNGFVVESGSELIEAREAAAPDGDQGVNGDVEDAGRLAQTRLRSGEAHSIGIGSGAVHGGMKKGRADRSARPMLCLGNAARPLFEVLSCQPWRCCWKPPANSPWGC